MRKIMIPAVVMILLLSSFSDPFWSAHYLIQNNTPYYLQINVEWRQKDLCERCTQFSLAPYSKIQFYHEEGIVLAIPQELIASLSVSVNRNSKTELLCTFDDRNEPKWITHIEGFHIHYALAIEEMNDDHKPNKLKPESSFSHMRFEPFK